MGKIEFTMENLKKCICPTCPVQADSACAEEKLMKMQEIMQEMEDKLMSNPEMVPALYCASGKTSCKDLDFDQICQCNYCGVWKENDLENGEPMGFFCRDGIAK
jgi:hypothetical protein